MKKLLLILCIVLISSKTKGQYTTNTSLNKFIEEWIGCPYRFGGMNKKGIDCSAFTQKLYKDVYNINLPRTCFNQYQFLYKVDLKDVREGDILFFSSVTSPSGWHCGVYLGNDWFVHSSNARGGVKISCLLDPMYQRIFKKAGRIKQ